MIKKINDAKKTQIDHFTFYQIAKSSSSTIAKGKWPAFRADNKERIKLDEFFIDMPPGGFGGYDKDGKFVVYFPQTSSPGITTKSRSRGRR